MSTLVSRKVLDNPAPLFDAFLTARPFRHVVIDDFFERATAEAMLAEFKDAVTGGPGRGGIYGKLDAFFQTAEFLQLMEKLTGIPHLRHDPWYYEAGARERAAGARTDAQLDFNLDPKTLLHHRLNALVWLSKDWDRSWGGAIGFHRDPWDLDGDQIVEVAPEFNRCVIFETTERSWYSVAPIRLPPDSGHASQKTFSLCLYTESRPEAEQAPGHGSLHVQEGLPRHLRAGQLLSAEDHAAIAQNIARRHACLRRLHEQAYALGEQLGRQEEEIKSLRQSQKFPVLGYAKLARVSTAPYHDGWIGAQAGCSILPLRPVRGLRLFAFRPEALGAVPVRFKANSKTVTVNGTGSFTADLWFESTVQSKIDVAIEAPAARAPGSGDAREISIIVDRVELLE